MAQIEVEVRGELDDFDKALEFFKKKAKFIEEKDRFSFIYFRKHVDSIEELKDDPVDLRVRITNKKAEIIMKYGKWGASDQRHEISIPIDVNKFDEAVQLFKYLNWDKGQKLTTKTFVFDYRGIEFALVKCEHYNYFEAEKVVEHKKDIEQAKKELEDVCNELKLKLFTEEEFMKILNKMNMDKRTLFDLSKHDFSDIKQEFKEFF